MGRKKTNQEFVNEVYELVGEDYTFLDGYINTSTKIRVRHNNDRCNNHEYLVKPNSFLSGNRCPKCSIISREGKSYPKFTLQDWNNHFKENLSNEYEQLSDFKGLKQKIKMKHKSCGTITEIQACNFKNNKPCKVCSHKITTENQKKTHREFCLEVELLGCNEFEVLESYRGNHTPIKLKHLTCNNEFNVAPNDFIKGRRCPKCSALKRRISQEEWDTRVKHLTGKEYTFLEDYKGNGTKIKVRHEKCGHVYSVKPNNYLSGYRCPNCKSSIGEQLISNYLSVKGIKFIPQHIFNDLKGVKGHLRYDFYLPEYNLLIEYNGLQHYKPIEFFGGIETYEKQVIRDRLKKDYAQINGYHLLEVPFYVSSEELVESKLNYELNKYYNVKQGILNQN